MRAPIPVVVHKASTFDLGFIKITSRGISSQSVREGNKGTQYVQRCVDEEGQELYTLCSAELQLKMPGEKDGLPLSSLIFI